MRSEEQRYQKENGVTKWYRKPRYIVLGIVIIVFCFVPMINMPYEVVVQKQVSEEYTTLEPYTVQEEVREPYLATVPLVGDMYKLGDPSNQKTIMKWKTVTKEVTEYREVTKTRLVTRPVVETRTKRVSLLRYLRR